MDYDLVRRQVETLPRPHFTPEKGWEVYSHIISNRPRTVLELGSGRGGSTAYLAAALEEVGNGRVLSVDSSRWKWRDPTAEEFISTCGLNAHVSFVRPYSTYNWFLRELLEEGGAEKWGLGEVDLAVVDGAKDFSTVGLCLVMLGRILCGGSWIVCDDIEWRYSRLLPSSIHFGLPVSALGEDELARPQVGEAFRQFVVAPGEFIQCEVSPNGLGWARRR